MNKKQEILDCIKTLNLTQEQANRLADVLASGGEGGSNKSVKFVYEYQEDDLITFKVNDKEIPFTKGNEGGVGEVCLINEQDFNYIENSIKGCGELQMESLSNDRSRKAIVGINVLYMVVDGSMKHYILEGPSLDSNTTALFVLDKTDNKYYFIMG